MSKRRYFQHFFQCLKKDFFQFILINFCHFSVICLSIQITCAQENPILGKHHFDQPANNSGELSDQELISEERFDKYWRWNINTPQEQIYVEKKGDQLFLKTLNPLVYEELIKNIPNQFNEHKFISKVSKGLANKAPFWISFQLKDVRTEVYSFYNFTQKRYVIDFWNNHQVLPNTVGKASSATHPRSVNGKSKLASRNDKTKKNTSKSQRPKLPMRSLSSNEAVSVRLQSQKDKLYRDFRYGSSFVWDYSPILPYLGEEILVSSEFKTAEEYFPVKKFETNLGDIENLYNFIVDLYKKKNWGLMYKTMLMFEKKFPDHDFYDLFDYMKANALIEKNFVKRDEKTLKMSISLYNNIADRTSSNELKKAIYTYLINFFEKKNDKIQLLNIANKLYTLGKKYLDLKIAGFAGEKILKVMAELGQIDEILKLDKDDQFVRLVSYSHLVNSIIYSYLMKNDAKKAIEYFEVMKKKAKWSDKLEPAIMYNLAEAHFREANYDQAKYYYDQFIKHYSNYSQSSAAQLRLALIYDITDRNTEQTSFLYRKAIDDAGDPLIQVEARIRLVGLDYVRPSIDVKRNKDLIRFLDNLDEVVKDHQHLQKILWLTRLRTLIVEERFSDALSYLEAIQLKKLEQVERKAFEGDGTEIITGLMVQLFKKQEYSQSIELYEKYKTIYFDKISLDPYILFLVARSYLELDIMNSVDQIMVQLKTVNKIHKTFPLWLNRPRFNADFYIQELELYRQHKLKNYDQIQQKIAENQGKIEDLESKNLTETKDDNYRENHLVILLDYFNNRREWKRVITGAESILSNEDQLLLITDKTQEHIVESYLNALYEDGQRAKFKNALAAILHEYKTREAEGQKTETNKDLKSTIFTTPKFVEGLRYKSLEQIYDDFNKGTALSSTEGKNLASEFNRELIEFKSDYKNSEFINRLNFIQAKISLATGSVEEAKKILNDLLNQQSTPEYLKGLSRSELTLLELKNKTI